MIFNLDTFFANGVAANFAPDSAATALVNPLGINPLGFNNGNILLGGDGSDTITGRGGNDIIDGDAWLHVELRDRGLPTSEIVREIRFDITDGDIDTAVFRDVMANYSISFAPDADGFYTISHNATVGVGGGVIISDGTDKVRNIERLQFADQTITIGDGPVNNALPTGALVITDNDANPLTPVVATVGTPLVATSTVADLDGITPGSVHFQWQQQLITAGGGLQWIDIANTDSLTFNPTNTQLGNALRVVETYVDGKGFHEQVTSAPTALLTANLAVNTAPFVVQQQNPAGLPDTTARTGVPVNIFLPLTVTFGDNETPAANLIFTAKLQTNGHVLDGSPAANGLTFTLVPDGAGGISGATITGVMATVGAIPITITITATDAGTPGVPLSALSATDTFLINVQSNGGAPFFPIATPLAITGATEDTLFNGPLATVVPVPGEAAQDPTNDPLAYRLVAGSAVNGSVTLNGNGTFTFQPATDFAGTATFRYYATDGLLKSAERTVQITVAAADDGTAPANLTGTAAAGGTLSSFLGFDPDGDIVPGSEQYQWLRDGVAIGGATSADYTVLAGDIGHEISVRVSYTDGQGNVNDGLGGHLAPSVSDPIFIGDVSVTGTKFSDVPSFTGTMSITDPDGITSVTFTWETFNGTNWVPAVGTQSVDGLSFVPTLPAGVTTLAGSQVRATAHYIDDLGNLTDVVGSAVHYIIDTTAGHTIAGTAATDLIFGNGGTDLITAGAGDDFVLGGAGSDTFFASLNDGNDVYDGGLGIDTYDMSGAGLNAATNVDMSLAEGSSTSSQTGTDVLIRVENVIGSAGANTIIGSSVANDIRGGAGNDRLTGGAGGDTLRGQAGNDTFIATINDGNDTYNGGTDFDTLDLSGTSANATVNLNAGTATSGQIGNDTLSNIEAVIGGSGNDQLTGSGADERFTGGAGADNINAGGGNDTIVATIGDGNTDNYNGGNGTDTLDMSALTQTVTVNLNNALVDLGFAVVSGAEIGTDLLSGFLNQSTIEVFIGGSGDDSFIGRTAGGANAVTFNGGAGNDTFTAGSSIETMTGGIGNDIFKFLTSAAIGNNAATRSVITDFAHGSDIIDLTALDAISGGADNAFNFVGLKAGSGLLAAGEIGFFVTAGHTIIEGNIGGVGGAVDFQIDLLGSIPLTAIDFHP